MESGEEPRISGVPSGEYGYYNMDGSIHPPPGSIAGNIILLYVTYYHGLFTIIIDYYVYWIFFINVSK